MAKLAVRKRDWTLLMNSEVADNHPRLKYLYENFSRVKEHEVNSLPDDDRILLSTMRDTLIKQAETEWTIDGESVRRADKSENVACELCMKKQIQDICVIQNKITSKKMTVGSECVKHFEDYRKLDIAEIRKKGKEVARLELLYKHFPNLQKNIQDYRVFINSQPILIISSISDGYERISEQIDDLHKQYVTATGKKTNASDIKIITAIEKHLKELESQKECVLTYVAENKGKKLIPTSKIVATLKRANSREAEQALIWLGEDGVITHRTLPRINDFDLANALVDDFRKHTHKYKMNVISAEDRGGVLYYRVQFLDKDFVLHLRHGDFANEFGSLLTDGEYLPNLDSYKEMIAASHVLESTTIENSIYHYVEVVNKLRIPLAESISVDQVFSEYKDVAFHFRKDKQYLLCDFNEFVNTFKQLLFVDDGLLAERFLTLILQSNRKYSYSDYGELKRVRGYE